MAGKTEKHASKLPIVITAILGLAVVLTLAGVGIVRLSAAMKAKSIQSRTTLLDGVNKIISETPLEQAQKVEAVVSVLSSYLAKYPDDARAHRLMAMAYDYLSYINYDRYDPELLSLARTQITEAIKYDPTGWKNQSLLITNYVHAKEFDKAKEILAEHGKDLTDYARADARITIARGEEDWPTMVEAGEALLKLARTDAERRDIYESMLMAYTFMDNCPRVKELNGMILEISGRAYDKVHYADYFSHCEKNYGEAVRILREVLAQTDTPAIRSTLSSALSNKASQEVNAGNYAEAGKLVSEALSLDPENDHTKYVRDFMNGGAR